MSVIIDSREDQEKIMSLLTQDSKLFSRVDDFKIQKLDLGDYLITRKDNSTLLIERKSVPDFCRSLWSKATGNGSFKSKLMRMSACADEKGLLIEGDYLRGDGGQLMFYWGGKLESTIPYHIFASFLYHRQKEGCKVFFTRTLKETLHLMLILNDDEGATPNLKVDNVEQFMMLIPGMGKKGVDKLKENYKSPAEAFKDIENWKRIRLDLEKW